MLRMLLRKIDLTSEKIGQWWRNLKVVSMSLPQQQIGFKQSRKLYLNLWSRRWLKPNLSLATNFILVGLWQLKVLFEDACINCKMLFWKKVKLSELLYTFVKIITLNYRVLKKRTFDIVPRNVVDVISCSTCCPSGGDFIKQILRGLTFRYFKEIAKFSKPLPLL